MIRKVGDYNHDSKLVMIKLMISLAMITKMMTAVW
jgi:hypothetical protein